MKDAIDRCEHFAPALRSIHPDLEMLRDVRNGVVHLGHVPTDTSNRLLAAFIRACEILLGVLDQSPITFWESQYQKARGIVDRESELMEERVRRSITEAKQAFEDRFSQMNPEWRTEVINLIVTSYEVSSIDRDLYDCPACGTSAMVEGWLEPDYDVDFEKSDGMVYFAGATLDSVSLAPRELECRACGLRLNGTDELRSAGVERSWELPDADPELVSEWETDFWSDF